MSKKTISEKSIEELEANLKAINTIAVAIFGIFLVIILGWIIPGYWKENIAPFVATICVALGVTASQLAVRGGIAKEIARRKAEGSV